MAVTRYPPGGDTSTLIISSALTADDSYNGIQITGKNAGATIAQWEIVVLNSSSKWILADANGAGLFPSRGIAVAAYVNNDFATILTYGTVRNDAWNWTAGSPIYLSGTPGGLTQTAPSVSGDNVQEVGVALDADTAFFHFCPSYVTLA